jgi:RNA ligase (TIGR02306 family)
MERKLASIQKVIALVAIEGADRIELAKVLGWQCVVKKGDFQPGDLGVFFEIDSIVDSTNPAFSFLADKKYRVRSCRFKKQLSQGLFVPLSYLDYYKNGENKTWQEGDDVTEHTKTIKHEIPVPVELQGVMRGSFPTVIIPKTDEQRIQSFPNVLNELIGREVYGSIKMDGTSFTAFKFEGQKRICSRNVEFKVEENPDNLYVKMGRDLEFPDGFGVQAEICGQSVQGNKMGLVGQKLYVFNVYHIFTRQYLDYRDFVEFCNRYGMTTVPVIYQGLFPFNTIEEMLADAEKHEYDNHTPAEGVVWRPTVETYSYLIGRLSIKAISNKFLLKYGE